MAQSYLTSDTLIASVLRRAAIPESQVTFLDADLLAFANEELMMGLLPSVLQFHEEFFVYQQQATLIANQSYYDIPSRAIGNKLRSVFYADANNNWREMSRILPDDVPYYAKRDMTNYPGVFYLQNNQLVMVPALGPNITGSLVFLYFQRPNQLVTADRIANVTAVNTSTGDVTVDTIPSIFTASGAKLDLLQTAGNHACLAIDLTPTGVSGSIISFGAALPSKLQAGDIVCLAGESYIPQLPDDIHVVLAQRVACRCLEALGDTQGLTNANQKLLEMEQKMGNLIDNRTEGQPQKVNNLRSPLRFSKMSYRGWNF